jgi:hypothetical protein
MAQSQANGMDDTQLMGVLDETATWAVVGERGEVLTRFASLREAVKKAIPSEVQLLALRRETGNSVIVFAGQLERLAKVVEVSWPDNLFLDVPINSDRFDH